MAHIESMTMKTLQADHEPKAQHHSLPSYDSLMSRLAAALEILDAKRVNADDRVNNLLDRLESQGLFYGFYLQAVQAKSVAVDPETMQHVEQFCANIERQRN